MVSWYVALKLGEWVIWWAIGIAYIIKSLKATTKQPWISRSLALGFFVFGVADLIEYFTRGSFPWWLWVWKIAGGLALFTLLIIDDYYKRGSKALAPWRFGPRSLS